MVLNENNRILCFLGFSVLWVRYSDIQCLKHAYWICFSLFTYKTSDSGHDAIRSWCEKGALLLNNIVCGLWSQQEYNLGTFLTFKYSHSFGTEALNIFAACSTWNPNVISNISTHLHAASM